jgi:hypothetical protein
MPRDETVRILRESENDYLVNKASVVNAMDLDIPSELTEESSTSTQLLRNSPDSRLTSRSTPFNGDNEKGNSGSILELVNPGAARDDHFEPRPPSPSLYQTGLAITRIEELIEAMADCILGKRNKLTIKLKSRASRGANSTEDFKRNTRSVNFPSTSPREAWKFGEFAILLMAGH